MNCVKGSIHKSWDNFSASSVSDPVSQPLSLHSVHPLLLKDKGECWVHLVGCSVGKELHFSSQWYDGKQLQQRVSYRWVSSISGLSRSQAWDQIWEYNAQNCLRTEIRAEEVRALRASAGQSSPEELVAPVWRVLFHCFSCEFFSLVQGELLNTWSNKDSWSK